MWDFVGTERNRYLPCIDNVNNELVSAKSGGTLITKKKQKLRKCNKCRVHFSFFLFYLCARRKLYITVTKFEIKTVFK